MEMLLQVKEVNKKIKGKKILDQVNLDIQPGKIIGLLGSNGSGKTTLMKSIAGLLKTDSGMISLHNKPISTASKAKISFMPDFFTVERNMKIKELLRFYTDFYEDFDNVKAQELLSFMKLNEEDRIKTLSKGMNERLALVVTLSRNASIYLLDEPIGGIDPVARERILEAIITFYSPDSTIILSTHLIHDIESVFDEVVFIKGGKIILHEDVEDIRMKRQSSVVELFKEVYAEC